MSKRTQYYSTICPEDNKPSVYMRLWDDEGVEHIEFVKSYPTLAAAVKGAASYQTKEDKAAAEQKKKDGVKNFLDYLLGQFNFTGTEREALKFAKRYLTSDQIKNVYLTGKTK